MTIDDAIIERHKAFFEYLKHLATLSAGSILLIATLLQKVFTDPRWKAAVVVSLIGFVASLICSVVYYSLALYYFPGVASMGEGSRWGSIMTWSLITAWLGMLVGLIPLSTFAIANLT
jgi:hypothetical protein